MNPNVRQLSFGKTTTTTLTLIGYGSMELSTKVQMPHSKREGDGDNIYRWHLRVRVLRSIWTRFRCRSHVEMSTAQRIPKCLACGNRLGIRVDSHPSEDFRARITQWRQHTLKTLTT